MSLFSRLINTGFFISVYSNTERFMDVKGSMLASPKNLIFLVDNLLHSQGFKNENFFVVQGLIIMYNNLIE